MRENREASETPAAQPGRRFGGRRPEPRGSLFALFATVRQQTMFASRRLTGPAGAATILGRSGCSSRWSCAGCSDGETNESAYATPPPFIFLGF
jgi:hypothetical protein